MIAIQDAESAVADFLVEEWFESVRNQYEIRFGTETQLTRLRIGSCRQEVSLDKVVTHTGKVIDVTYDCVLEKWPEELTGSKMSHYAEMSRHGFKRMKESYAKTVEV